MEQYILGLLLVIVIYIIIAPFTKKEHFIQYENPYKQNILSYTPKKNDYMNFLGNVNDAYHKYLNKYKTTSSTPLPQTLLCNDRIKLEIQKNALQDGFDKINVTNLLKKYDITNNNTEKEDSIKDYEIDTFIKSKNKDCLYKSNHLCELTNPMLYLSENKYFPPRWIFKPYANVPLPKHIDLKCWNNMFNCCNKNF
jgi:hypothetical protein